MCTGDTVYQAVMTQTCMKENYSYYAQIEYIFYFLLREMMSTFMPNGY